MNKIFTRLTLLFCFVGLCSFSLYKLPAASGFAVIVNSQNPISTLGTGDVKMYFLRKLKNRWPGINKNIKPVTRKSKCAERDAFYSAILKMADAEVDNYFSERQFQNAEKQPDRFASDAEIIEFVGQEIGGIGFVSSKSLGSSPSVKVILEF